MLLGVPLVLGTNPARKQLRPSCAPAPRHAEQHRLGHPARAKRISAPIAGYQSPKISSAGGPAAAPSEPDHFTCKTSLVQPRIRSQQ